MRRASPVASSSTRPTAARQRGRRRDSRWRVRVTAPRAWPDSRAPAPARWPSPSRVGAAREAPPDGRRPCGRRGRGPARPRSDQNWRSTSR
eukprot:4173275-Prymnesium_polylepis.1